MKKTLLAFIVLISFASCIKAKDFNPYSPLDHYIETTNKAYYENVKSNAEAKAFIDSLNNSHK